MRAAGILAEFDLLNISVYIDWLADEHDITERVTGKNAKLIRNRMKQCRTLIFLQTRNATVSRWVPWELGFCDGLHGKVAKIKTKEAEDKKSPYLSIYPTVRSSRNNDFHIFQGNEKKYSIRDWINT